MDETETVLRFCSRPNCTRVPPAGYKMCQECRDRNRLAYNKWKAKKDAELDAIEDAMDAELEAVKEARRREAEVEQFKADAASVPVSPEFAEACRRYVMACLSEV